MKAAQAKTNMNTRLINWSKERGEYCENVHYSPFPHKLMRCYGLIPTERLVLQQILSHFGINNYAFPSQRTIAADLGLSKNTVHATVKKLKEKGFITSRKTKGSDIYSISKLEDNPYILLSEATHYFKKRVKFEQEVEGIHHNLDINEIISTIMSAANSSVGKI